MRKPAPTVTIALEGVLYIVTTSTGYRAELQACGIDHATEDGRTPCAQHPQHPVDGKRGVDAWLKHSRKHCHGWHSPGRVDTLAAAVLKTYPKGK